jgi:rubrerythrin
VKEREWSLGGVSAEELFEMAAAVEQGGFDFYARLTSRSTDPRVRNDLRYLRDEEGVHKSWFLSQLRAGGSTPCGSLSAALQKGLDHEFLGPLERIFSTGDADAALRFGPELAQRSIALYQAMREVVLPGQQTELDRIIVEEESHRQRVELLLASSGRNPPAAD